MYFNNFPTIQYPIPNGQLEQAKDILIRFGFTDKIKEQSQSFISYEIYEGQTPEKIAEEVYGDQQYFWVVLLFNDLFDPLYRFPMRSKSLDKFIDKKYPSKTLFLSPVGISQEFYKHPVGGTSTVANFREGDTITVYLGKRNKYKDDGPNKVLGVVKRYIPEISAVQLHQLQGHINTGDTIARGYDTEIRASVKKVSDSRYAVHHFEDDNIILNPMATPPSADQGDQVPLGQTGEGFANPVGVTQTILENYINDGVNTYVKTNEVYEFDQNEKNRKIKLLNPTLLENVTRELREVLSN
jgi:hypothetical protein